MSSFAWKELCVESISNGNRLISDLSGQVNEGEFLSIMGPSGSGKSTFLQSLVGRLNLPKHFKASGKIFLDGIPCDSSKFSKFGAFVRQDDVLFSCLTVQQTIEFHASLRIEDRVEREERVKRMIQLLGLQECKDLKIGGQLIKSISGGQRKRTAIAIELISDPNCIVLDEPTSGLDSYNALIITQILRKLAQKGRIVIATVHQPSSRMFHEFDRLMLIRSGELLYFGAANQITSYMQSLSIHVNLKMNPADFFMLQMSAWNEKTRGRVSPMTAEVFQSSGQLVLKDDQELPKSFVIQSKINKQVYQAPYSDQIKQLTIRALRNWYRSPLNQLGKLMNMIMAPLFLIGVYMDLGRQAPQQPSLPSQLQNYLQAYICCIFIHLFISIGLTVYDTVMIFPVEREVFYKEVSSKLYNTYIYFFTRYLVQLAGIIVPPIWICAIVYYPIGLTDSTIAVSVFFATHCLTSIAGANLGLIVGLSLASVDTAVSLLPLIMVPVLLFGGLMAKLTLIPKYISWVQYISPVRYGFSAIMLSQLEGKSFLVVTPVGVVDADWKEVIGVSGATKQNMLYLGMLTLLLGVVALILLRIKQRSL